MYNSYSDYRSIWSGKLNGTGYATEGISPLWSSLNQTLTAENSNPQSVWTNRTANVGENFNILANEIEWQVGDIIVFYNSTSISWLSHGGWVGFVNALVNGVPSAFFGQGVQASNSEFKYYSHRLSVDEQLLIAGGFRNKMWQGSTPPEPPEPPIPSQSNWRGNNFPILWRATRLR